jgi:hypothetical protein
MDPAAMGGGAPPIDIQSIVSQVVQQLLPQLQRQMGGAAGGTGGPAGPGKNAKIDPGMIYMELGRVRKLLTTMFQNLNWDLPPDILDDQMVAQSVAGQLPASQPTDAGGGAAPGLPAMGGAPAINPIAPAGGDSGGGSTKSGSVLELFNQRKGMDGMNQNLDLLHKLFR